MTATCGHTTGVEALSDETNADPIDQGRDWRMPSRLRPWFRKWRLHSKPRRQQRDNRLRHQLQLLLICSRRRNRDSLSRSRRDGATRWFHRGDTAVASFYLHSPICPRTPRHSRTSHEADEQCNQEKKTGEHGGSYNLWILQLRISFTRNPLPQSRRAITRCSWVVLTIEFSGITPRHTVPG